MRRELALLLAVSYFANGADWLTYAGSPQRTGWIKAISPPRQTPRKGPFGIFEDDDDEDPNEVFGTPLRKNTIAKMPLLWKLQVDASSFAAPLIVQKIITQRGFKELAIVASNKGLFVVDADLGRLFWKRDDLRSTATPVVAQTGNPIRRGFPRYGVYALDDQGSLHALRLDDAAEGQPAVPFVPAESLATSLNRFGNTVYTTTSNGIWAMDQRPASFAVAGGASTGGVAIGLDGTVYAGSARGLLSLTPDLKLKDTYHPPSGVAEVTPVVVGSNIIGATTDGRLFLLHGPSTAPVGEIHGIAAWSTGWVYATTAHGVTGFKLEQKNFVQAWRSPEIQTPLTPVILNGIVFVVSGAKLYALDATTGKVLYSSGNIMTSPAATNGITVANDRVYVATSDGTIYCFGYPIDQ